MKQFLLPDAEGPFTLDTDGHVLDQNKEVLGTWTVTSDNAIRIMRAGKPSHDVAVEWGFNSNNQLTIKYATQTIFVAAADMANLPWFRLADNQLVAELDGDRNFSFNLQCKYALEKTGDLRISIDGVESILKGYISGSNSRLQFIFTDEIQSAAESRLTFSGRWQQPVNDKKLPIKDKLALEFVLDKDAGIAGKPLTLPGDLQVDYKTNQLFLAYQVPGAGKKILTFTGSLTVRPNWTLDFAIVDVVNGQERTISASFDTNFKWKTGDGQIFLDVGSDPDKKTPTISIGGKLSATYNQGTVTWSASFQKGIGGNTSSLVVATEFRFSSDGTNLMISYKQQNGERTLTLGSMINTDRYTITTGAGISVDGSTKTVGVFLGIHFNA